jgi:hypothetical protein
MDNLNDEMAKVRQAWDAELAQATIELTGIHCAPKTNKWWCSIEAITDKWAAAAVLSLDGFSPLWTEVEGALPPPGYRDSSEELSEDMAPLNGKVLDVARQALSDLQDAITNRINLEMAGEADAQRDWLADQQRARQAAPKG